jgi:DNA-binding MarR family transcriptional regulator
MPPLKIEEEIIVALRQITRAIGLHSKQLMKEYGLTTPQILVLKAAEALGNPTLRSIADAVNLTSATVSIILDKLIHKGYLTKAKDQVDRRKSSIELTARGKEVLLTSPKPLQSHFLQQLECLEPWEQLQMLSCLQRIATMMKAHQFEAAPILFGEDLKK